MRDVRPLPFFVALEPDVSGRGKAILHVACSIAMGVAWHPAAGVFWFAWDPWDLIPISTPPPAAEPTEEEA